MSIVTCLWTRGGVVSRANLAEHINPFNDEVHQGVAAMGGSLQRHAAAVNGVISLLGMQISFNHIFDGPGISFFLLIGWCGCSSRRSSTAARSPVQAIDGVTDGFA